MQTIDDPGDALAVLHDPGFVVPPVPAATHGVGWLRATVGRFSTGEAHTRRRALSEALLSTVDPRALRETAASSPVAHPVQHLATALGLDSSARTIDAVRAVAAAYQPGTGDETAADAGVRTLIDTFGGTPDEATAARIGVLVQACDATATLIARARSAGLETVLRDTPPVPATKRMATRPADLGGTHVAPGEIVRVSLHGIPFGAGPRRCPAQAHALALAEGALSAAGEGALGRAAEGASSAVADGTLDAAAGGAAGLAAEGVVGLAAGGVVGLAAEGAAGPAAEGAASAAAAGGLDAEAEGALGAAVEGNLGVAVEGNLGVAGDEGGAR
jgi:hypothetical protein